MSDLAGSSFAVFAVTLSQAAAEDISIEWYTEDGTGKAGKDYIASSGTLIFPAGTTADSLQVEVLAAADATTTSGKTFNIRLKPSTSAIVNSVLTGCVITVSEGSKPVTTVVIPAGPRGANAKDGEDGQAGKDGDAGLDGRNGSVWYTGVGKPDSTLGLTNDFYLDTANSTNGDVWQKGNAGWSKSTNLRGDNGATGANLINRGPWVSGTTYAPGSYVSATGSTKTLSLYFLVDAQPFVSTVAPASDNAHWIELDSIEGPQGEQIQLQVTEAKLLQAKYPSSNSWTTLLDLNVFTGKDGADGSDANLATLAQAKSGTATDVATTPEGMAAYLAQYLIGVSASVAATDLNTSLKGAFFTYDNNTLHTPAAASYGRGFTIPSSDGNVTQMAIENGTGHVYVRYLTAGKWDESWTQTGFKLASSEEAKAAASASVALTPAGQREFLDQFGLGSTYTSSASDLNSLVNGAFFSYGASTANAPAANSYGRGFCVPGDASNVTQFAIENTTATLYARFKTSGKWGAWLTLTGSASGGGADYELPVASDSVLGGVKVGQGLAISSNGVLMVLAGMGAADLVEAAVTVTGTALTNLVYIDAAGNTVYSLRALIPYSVDALTHGIKVSITGDANLSLVSFNARALGSDGNMQHGHASAIDTPVTLATAAAMSGNLLVVEGLVYVLGAGTVRLRVASTAAEGSVTVAKGAAMALESVGTL